MAKRRAPLGAMNGSGFGDTDLQSLLGTAFIRRLHDPSNPESHPLKIGTQTYSRYQVMVELGCPHPLAPRVITRIADDLKAKNVRDFYSKADLRLLASEPGVGEACLHTVWRLFVHEGLDVHSWLRKGKEALATEGDALVSFHTTKARVQRQESEIRKTERREARKRKRATHEAAVADLLGNK